VIPPDELELVAGTKLPKKFECDSKNELRRFYESMHDRFTKENESQIVTEGAMLYALTSTGWRQFKLKAEQIERIHWAAGGIPHLVIRNTAINAYEHTEPTVDDLIQLLLEEFDEQKIEASMLRIEKVFKEVKDYMQDMAEVNRAWALAKEAGLDITVDRNGTMRFISQFFDRSQMKRIGTMVLKTAGLLDS
jgi:hypothetical protein